MILFWIIIFAVYSLLVLFLFFRFLSLPKTVWGEKKPKVTLIVPFRDEEHSIPTFLSSLDRFKTCPEEVLFINDHSTDQSEKLFVNSKYQMINLKEGFGKKKALLKGVEIANSEFVIFNDVDLIHPEKYDKLFSVSPMQDFDVGILPVWFQSENGLLNKLVRLDYAQIQFFTFAYQGNLGNGANLFTKKEVFLKYSSGLETEVLSGDDYFFIKEVRKHNGVIRYILDPDVTVKSDAPKSISALLKQRARWIKKSFQKGNALEIGATFFWILFSFIPYGLFFSYLNTKESICLWFLLAKFIVDLFIFVPFLSFNKNLRLLYLLPLLEIIYPFYYLAVLIRAGFKNSWKGRDL